MKIITGFEPMVTPYLGGGYETRIGAAMLRTHEKPEVSLDGIKFKVGLYLTPEQALNYETDIIDKSDIPIQAVRSEEPNEYTNTISYDWYELNVKET